MITIEDLKKKQAEPSRLIGLDLGSKRIGVSICDERQSIATPFKTITKTNTCLLYTSDAADEQRGADLGGRRIIKKKKKKHNT